MKQFQQCRVIITMILILTAADVTAIERRQPQFETDLSYMLLPAPYSVSGIGEGVIFSAIANNFASTYIDIMAVSVTGDAEGSYVEISDMHLISKMLILSVSNMQVSKFSSTHYKSRGMDSDKENRSHIVAGIDEQLVNLTLTTSDRRYSLYHEYSKTDMRVQKAFDKDGNLLFEFSNPEVIATQKSITGFMVDYTDDYVNPEKGVRFQASRSNSPRVNSNDSNFFVINKSVNFYIPLGKKSVWAIHLSQSDAEVTDVGEIDRDKIATELGLGCLYSACTTEEQSVIDGRRVERLNGTANSLGGMNELRSYPMDRFQGGHSQVFSTEFRYNISDNVTPFDYWIWKDTSAKIQLAVFYDVGTVSESTHDLWDQSTYSAGVGIRMVATSGYVYRADVANGNEGTGFTMMFEYPW